MIFKLSDYAENIQRGAILRCKGKYPYEDFVDFMVVENNSHGVINYSLMVVSGYKAGLVHSQLPMKSIPGGNEGFAISTDWLRLNWDSWGYFDCPWEEVHLLLREPPLGFDDH